VPDPISHQNGRSDRSDCQKSAIYRSYETSRERLSSPLRPCCLAHRVDTITKSDFIKTTGRYPCLVPPGTVTPKLTGQKHPTLESDFSSARTGILSSLLFSRSQKGYGTHHDQDFHPQPGVGATLTRKQLPPTSEEPSYNHPTVRTTCLKDLWRIGSVDLERSPERSSRSGTRWHRGVDRLRRLLFVSVHGRPGRCGGSGEPMTAVRV
jgi:hypothetical protein